MALTTSKPSPNSSAEAHAAQRELAFDAYKGIAILAVILHHISGLGVRSTVIGSSSHLLAASLNRTLLFCVPAFLFLTVFLLSRSLLRRPMPPVEFWKKRFPRILAPYLLWSVFYVFYNVWTGSRTYHDLLEWESWWNWLLLGKAYYHLYFLVIVLQIYLFLPGLIHSVQIRSLRRLRTRMGLLLVLACLAGLYLTGAASMETHGWDTWFPRLLRWIGWLSLGGALYLLCEGVCTLGIRMRMNLWGWAALAFAIQVGAYGLHKVAIRSPYPATLLLSYILPIFLGVWTACNWNKFQRRWNGYRRPLGLLTLAMLILFMPLALRMVDGQPVSPLLYQATYSAYTSMALLWLFGICGDLTERFPNLSGLFAVPGRYSMELYLIHPAVLTLINRYPIQGTPAELGVYIMMLFFALTGFTLFVALVLRRMRLGEALFGK